MWIEQDKREFEEELTQILDIILYNKPTSRAQCKLAAPFSDKRFAPLRPILREHLRLVGENSLPLETSVRLDVFYDYNAGEFTHVMFSRIVNEPIINEKFLVGIRYSRESITMRHDAWPHRYLPTVPPDHRLVGGVLPYDGRLLIAAMQEFGISTNYLS